MLVHIGEVPGVIQVLIRQHAPRLAPTFSRRNGLSLPSIRKSARTAA